MCFNQRGDISTLNISSLKLVDKCTYLGSSVSSTETDINARLAKAWTAIDSLSVIWKSDLIDEIKRSFFQAAVVLILLYGRWLNIWRKSFIASTQECCEQYWASPGANTPQNSSYTATYHHNENIQIRRNRHAGHCWRNKDEPLSDILQWTPSHGWAKAGRPARTYIQQLCGDTDIALKTSRKRWTIETGGERGSGRSVLAAWHDDNN